MGGAAEHAAVNENVELAKQARPHAAGLVNAVLRRGAREGPAILAGLNDESPEAAAVMAQHGQPSLTCASSCSTVPRMYAALKSLIDGISAQSQYMLVAGAVAGGGLTVIANAPNPAGVALLRHGFRDESIGAGGLLAGALAPTVVAMLAFFL